MIDKEIINFRERKINLKIKNIKMIVTIQKIAVE